MHQDGLKNRELVSALVDGQLRGAEFARVVEAVQGSPKELSAWHAYHLIGDSLRDADLAVKQNELAFASRFRARLAAMEETEPASLRAVDKGLVAAAALPVAFLEHGDKRESANDAVLRWKLLAGAASLAAVTAIGWQLAASGVGAGASPQLAANGGQTATVALSSPASDALASSGPQVMLRDARLDELLAAHKQFGGTSALQMPAGFLRNATFENPGR